VSRLRLWLRRLVLGVAVAYPVSLLVLVLVLRGFGDTWWLARALLYVPRIFLGAPLLLFVPLLAWMRAWRFLSSQLAALLLLLVPLMGLVLPWPRFADKGQPLLRVMSYNVNGGNWGWHNVLAQIDELHPDVLLIQEAVGDTRWALEQLRKRFPIVEQSTQFIVATKYPIRAVVDPTRVQQGDRQRSPRSMSYTMDTPLGPIAFYNVHPISPRHGLWSLRVGGFRNAIKSGTIFDKQRTRALEMDGQLSDLQVALAAGNARKETIPVIIAGDTNLTVLHPALANLSGYTDGFRAASWGFGYTFPSGRRAWMRLDRIFAGPQLRFVGFQVGKRDAASDHRAVAADLQRR
jgi:endonuclease/exonuclease/phosphatase (EEP) superfamily protein YafD